MSHSIQPQALSDESLEMNSEDSRSPEGRILSRERSANYASFWKSELFADCTIIVDRREIKVHRFVLSSKYRKKMVWYIGFSSILSEIIFNVIFSVWTCFQVNVPGGSYRNNYMLHRNFRLSIWSGNQYVRVHVHRRFHSENEWSRDRADENR